jgi:hypothetical protein
MTENKNYPFYECASLAIPRKPMAALIKETEERKKKKEDEQDEIMQWWLQYA